MPQSSNSGFYKFLAFSLLLNVTFLNGAVIRRERREITTNVTGITALNNEVDLKTATAEEEVGILLLKKGDDTTTNKIVTEFTTTGLSDGKKDITTLTGFTVDENTVSFASDGKGDHSESKHDDVGSTKNVEENTTVSALSIGKVEMEEETSTLEHTTSNHAVQEESSTIEQTTINHFIQEEPSVRNDGTTQSDVTTSTLKEDATPVTSEVTVPTFKKDENVTTNQVTESVIGTTSPSVEFDKKLDISQVTESESSSQVPVDSSTLYTNVKDSKTMEFSQVTERESSSQVPADSSTLSTNVKDIETTAFTTAVEATTIIGLTSDESATVNQHKMMGLSEKQTAIDISTKSLDLTADSTQIPISTTSLPVDQQQMTDDNKSLTSTMKSDETTLILTSTEAFDESPSHTTIYASPLHQDGKVKNSTSSSAEKRGKFIDDNYTSLNELRLPNTSDVWALAGLKSAGNVKSSELQNSVETSDEKAVNNSMVTKNLLDWSRVMNSNGFMSETTVKTVESTTTEVPKTTNELKTPKDNEVLTSKTPIDVTTEVLTDKINIEETTSQKENELDTNAPRRPETTTDLRDESTTPERIVIGDTFFSYSDELSTTTKSSLTLLRGADDAFIEDNQVDPDSVEEKPPSPVTPSTTSTPSPDIVVTMKSETTNPPVNGETTELENTSTFLTSTLSVIDFTTAMPFLTSTTMTTTTTTSSPSIAFNMDDRTNEPPNMSSYALTPTQQPTAPATVEPDTTTTTTTTSATPAVTVMAATTETETQTTEAHTPAIISNTPMTQNPNDYNNYEVVNNPTTKFADYSSVEASEASTRVATYGSGITAETPTTLTEVDRLDVDFDVTTTASSFESNNAYEFATLHPLTTVVSTFTLAPPKITTTATLIPTITPSSSDSTSTTEDLEHIDSIHKIAESGETSIESNVIDPLHAGEPSTTTTTTTTTSTTTTTTTTPTTTTESSQENMRVQSTGRAEMDSTTTTTTPLYDDLTSTLQSISTKKEDVYSIVPTIDSGFHVPKLVVDVTTMSNELAIAGAGINMNAGESMDSPDAQETDVNVIIAISVSVVGIVALILLVAFLYVMRKRQKQMSYGQRCRPVSLDAYSLDNVSVYNSVRRKGATLRASKRSYGNVAFDDPSLRHNVMGIHELAKYVEKKSSIWEEFKDVPQIIARADEVPAGCEDKNRYANVIPLPETRVILQQQNSDEKSEYINANYVRGPKDTTNYYIACQAPLETTVTDFWRMIWEQNSRVIIMATDLIENGIDKCAEYLPPSVTLDNHTVFGDFQVTLKNREVKEKYAISTLMLKNNVTEESREITHYWYQWPEAGVPTDEAAVIAMLLEARSSLKLYSIEQSDNKSDTIIIDDNQTKKNEINGNVTSEKSKPPPKDQGPLTIHCSPGTGRTGTLITCDVAMRCLEEPKRNVDIPQIVYSVRRGRASAVQTKEQYEFIYKVAHMYATKISNLNNDN